MGLKDKIAGFVPEEFRPPLTPVSYDELQEVLRAQGAKELTVTPNRRALGHKADGWSGQTATTWGYGINFDARGRRGRRIHFELACISLTSLDADALNIGGGRTVGARVTSDLEERYLLTTYVTADAYLQRIGEQMPECQTVLMDDGRPFTETDFEELHSQAKIGHIRSWDEE